MIHWIAEQSDYFGISLNSHWFLKILGLVDILANLTLVSIKGAPVSEKFQGCPDQTLFSNVAAKLYSYNAFL